MSLNGFHVYYQREVKEDSFDVINYLVQYSSILHWKKFYGPIHLYCNSLFLETLKSYGMDHLYDSINVEFLDSISSEKLEKFWSYCKLLSIRDISTKYQKFVVLDLDLWLKPGVEINQNLNLVAYHRENISDHPNNPYISPDNFLDTQKWNFDWSVRPLNCAILYFNSKKLIDMWVSIAQEVVNSSDTISTNTISSDTIFIEQRLLAVVCDKLDLDVETLIDNVYYPEVSINNQGLEWSPRIGHTYENLEITSKIKHVWGLKKRYDDPQIRNLILEVCIDSLDHNFTNWVDNATTLVNKIWQLQKQGDLVL